MSEQNYANVQQQADLMKYISDNMKIPVLGAGGGFAPIGKEGYIDGTLAPQGWLICDGSTHNIADYPELAAYFASHHGSANYYGGDGVTTFAVPTRNGMPTSGVDSPDEHIIGEVRKTVDGVLKRKPKYRFVNFDITLPNANGQVAKVGLSNVDEVSKISVAVHNTTDANYITATSSYAAMGFYYIPSTDYLNVADIASYAKSKPATLIIEYTKTTDSWQTVQEGHSSDGNGIFCVKATVSGDANAHQYSTDEQIVGTTEDGEVVYEITLKGDKPINTNNQNVSIPVSGTIVSYAIDGYIKTSGGDLVKLGYWNNAQTDSFQAFVSTSNKRICILPTNLAGTYRFVYQYTKTQ